MSEQSNVFGNVGSNTDKPDDGSGLKFSIIGGDDSDDATRAIDPASIAGKSVGTGDGGNGETGKRKRGRPRGRAAPQGETLSVEGLASILSTAHILLAALVKQEKLVLSDDEAKAVAGASVELSRHYGFAPSSKAVAWTNFAMVMGVVYGTRIVAIRADKAAARAAKKVEAEPAPAYPANVHEFPMNMGIHT